MRFLINYNDKTEESNLVYIEKDFYIDASNSKKNKHWELGLNYLFLSVDQERRIFALFGLFGSRGWTYTRLNLPNSMEGSLVISEDTELEDGFTNMINDEDWPVFVDTQSGWICYGKPNASGQGVEFIRNCVAVIGTDGRFMSLWLKPKELPKSIFKD